MGPTELSCKCNKVVPLSVKTDYYKIRASPVGCKTKTYMRIFSLNLDNYFEIEPQIYWNSCICNEYDALLRRHLLGDIIGFIPGNPAIKLLETNLKWMSSQMLPFHGVTHKVLMDNTRAVIKKRYKLAYAHLRTRVMNVGSREARAKTFVKYEKVPIGKMEARKPPRLIQFRDFTYLYCLKRQVLGHCLQVKNQPHLKWFYNQAVNTVFTKIYDNYGIAKVLWDSWNFFSDPVGVCLDHSKFDGHYCEALLRLEHDYWLRLNGSPALRYLLRFQLLNRAITMNGLKYKIKGSRLSGEYTTSEGNSVMNYAILVTWLRDSGVESARIHVNGDDSVVILERSELSKLKPLSYMNNFNMETENDRNANNFWDISYCQASPIRVVREGSVVWYMVKEPRRALSRIQYGDSKFLRVADRFLVGLGLCELTTYSGIPILQELASYLVSLKAKPLGCVDKSPALASGNKTEAKPIEWITRVDFERAFSIPPATQIEIEHRLAGLIRSPTDLQAKIKQYQQFIHR